jgi:hypothetical protein
MGSSCAKSCSSRVNLLPRPQNLVPLEQVAFRSPRVRTLTRSMGSRHRCSKRQSGFGWMLLRCVWSRWSWVRRLLGSPRSRIGFRGRNRALDGSYCVLCGRHEAEGGRYRALEGGAWIFLNAIGRWVDAHAFRVAAPGVFGGAISQEVDTGGLWMDAFRIFRTRLGWMRTLPGFGTSRSVFRMLRLAFGTSRPAFGKQRRRSWRRDWPLGSGDWTSWRRDRISERRVRPLGSSVGVRGAAIGF